MTLLSWAVAALLLAAALLVTSAPQSDSPPRARAVSSFSRANDADAEEPDDPPRKYGRRGYRSHCRCSRITNCPKLQITIPRCPPEEFVCCFS